nr:geranylgeranyl diphosphate synthase [Phoma sp.]
MPTLWEPAPQQVLHQSNGASNGAFAVQPTMPTIKSPVLSPAPQENGTAPSSESHIPPTYHYETIVRLPYDYVAASPSKGIREKLIKAFNAWYAVPPSTLEHITKAIGILHTASLLVDDIQDDSPLRRGSPAAHTVYGIPQTINSANYMYFMALRELQSLKGSRISDIFVEELLRLHLGQGMDLYWRDMLQCPTESEYFNMVSNKTGGLFRLAIKLMQAESVMPALEGIIPLVESLGILFQIRDDYQNLVSSEYRDQKGMCEDLTEGKFSYPVIHSIQSDRSNPQLLQILKLKSTSDGVKKLALDYMEGTGSLNHTRDLILTLISRARTLVNDVEAATGGVLEAKGLHMVLDRLADGL